MSCGIYKIENLINHNIYIGQSVNIEARWKRHKISKPDTSIHKAFKKYGLNNFNFEIIEECDRYLLNDREKYWIKYYDSYNNGYNETPGGENGGHSDKLTLLQVQKIQELLATSMLTNIEISQKFNVSENIISGINTGYYWKQDNIEYPIRKQFKKDIKYCCDCGKEILYTSDRCSDCAAKKRRKVERPNKEELYQILIINNGNFSLVGKMFGVTDNSIRKWCKKYDLPFHSKDYKKMQQTESKVKQDVKIYPVQQIDKKTGKIIKTYDSISQAERQTGIYHITEASDKNNFTRKTAGGYIWKRI